MTDTAARPLRVVSCATRGRYAKLADEMVRSAFDVGLEAAVHHFDDRGSWARNTHEKVWALLAARIATRGDLLFVDADARFHSDPRNLLPGRCDVAFYCRNGQPLGGTIYAADTLPARLFMAVWACCNTEQPWQCDQSNVLGAIAKTNRLCGDFLVGALPPELCFIFDHSRDWHPGVRPVIEHLQASRGDRDQGGSDHDCADVVGGGGHGKSEGIKGSRDQGTKVGDGHDRATT